MSAEPKTTWDRLNEFVAALTQEKRVPGVALGILSAGQTATGGFGVTNVEHPLPVTGETLFQIGSITKSFTAMAVMRLVEMGALQLDIPVRTYIPEFKVADEGAAAGATLRHLLTHTGGWEGDLFLDTGAGDDALSRYVAAMAGLEQLAPLGALYSYNNSGYSLAGRIIEVATGKRDEAAMQELVLGPLGLRRSYLQPTDAMTHRFVVGHGVGDKGAEVLRPWPLARSAFPAGGIVCDIHDLLRYARFHLGDGTAEGGTRLLSADSMSMMHAPQVKVWGDDAYGFGWFVDRLAGVRRVSHGGGTLGQSTLLMLVPERGFAVAVLTNAYQGGAIAREAVGWTMKEYLGLELPPGPKPMEATPEQLAAYAGRYASPAREMELALLCGRLVGQMVHKIGFPTRESPPPPAPPPMALGLSEPDRLLELGRPGEGGQYDILRKPDGSIGWLRASGRLHPRQP